MSKIQTKRLVVFGATGNLGQQLIEKLAESRWPIGEMIGVASSNSAGSEFEFRGEMLDVTSEWPTLKGRDFVFVCTPRAEALEVVREALRAEVPCIDCSGALANQEVAMPAPISMSQSATDADAEASIKTAPLLGVPAGTTLAWAPVLEALSVSRVVGTVLCSSSALGQKGVAALSGESIALFNQSGVPDAGPAGQSVAFDVVPGGGIDSERVREELRRLFGSSLSVALTSVQVPTFVGEGSSLSLTLSAPLAREAVEARLAAIDGVTLVQDGFGSRGLASVDEVVEAPIGPTLRDAIGVDEILIGRIEADVSQPAGEGWRLWLAYDPLRLTSDQVLNLARRRLGLT
jgi:aspartate-semialdehyde dehydrogenase